MSPRVTLRHVALAAGVSVATASKALNGRGRISSETKARVQDAARRLGYRADPIARNLRAGSSGPPLIAVVYDHREVSPQHRTPRSAWPMFFDALLEQVLERGHRMILLPDALDPELANLPINAVVVASLNPMTVALEGLPYGVRRLEYSLTGRTHPEATVTFHHDLPLLLSTALDHLTEAGSRRPALLWLAERADFAARCVAAYQQWCDRHGVRALDIAVGRDPGEVEAAVHQVLDSGHDSIFGMHGDAPSVLAAIESRGLRCPDDVHLLMQGEGILEAAITPPVSTVSFDAREAAVMVAESLWAEADADSLGTLVALPFTLTVRDSTRIRR